MSHCLRVEVLDNSHTVTTSCYPIVSHVAILDNPHMVSTSFSTLTLSHTVAASCYLHHSHVTIVDQSEHRTFYSSLQHGLVDLCTRVPASERVNIPAVTCEHSFRHMSCVTLVTTRLMRVTVDFLFSVCSLSHQLAPLSPSPVEPCS
jgi:hypothetical protein